MVRGDRRRYVVIHVAGPPGVGKGLLIKLIRGRTRGLEKEEFERIRPWFVYFQSGWAIIKVLHRGVNDLVGMIEQMNGTKLREGRLEVNIAGVSGTLKGAFHKFIPETVQKEKHYREELEEKG
jgi:RNase P/RNase MRP subunit POP5